MFIATCATGGPSCFDFLISLVLGFVSFPGNRRNGAQSDQMSMLQRCVFYSIDT